jgi:tetratricopeptide (TPR) repeat protein
MAQAQEDFIMFKDGTTLKGKVLSTTKDSVEFTYESNGKTETDKIPARQLTPHSFYEWRDRDVGNDAQANLDLAVFCAKNEMLTQAVMHHDRARDLDAALVKKFDEEELPALREKIASNLLESARKAVQMNDLVQAEADASLILARFNDTKAGEEARNLIDEVSAKYRERRTKIREQVAEAEGTDRRMSELLLKNGNSLQGEVLSSTYDSITFRHARGGGAVTITMEASRLDPHSFYTARDNSMEGTGEDHLRLAGFCIRNGLFTLGHVQYQLAKAADPELVAQFEKEDLPRVEEEIGADLIENAKLAINEGRLRDADRDLSFILTRLETTRVADLAMALLDELDVAFEKQNDKEMTDAVARYEAEERKQEEARWAILDPVKKTMESARMMNHNALKATRSGQAIKQFEGASRKFQQAVKQCDILKKSHAEDGQVIAMIDGVQKKAMDDAVDAILNAGNRYVDRSSFEQAMDKANEALKIDPDNQRASAFRQRVESYRVINASGRWRRR